MLKIGLTGGIASGKSTVAKYFAKLNIAIIDTDRISHSLAKPRTKTYKQIVAHFGDSICTQQGEIDRNLLRHIVFSSKKERLWLESLLHPIIYQKIQTKLTLVKSPYCVLVIPLLFETKTKEFRNIVDRVLVVDTTQKEQISRLMKRDKENIEEIMKILKSQSKRQYRLQHADDVIYNKTSLATLKESVLILHKKYLTEAGVQYFEPVRKITNLK